MARSSQAHRAVARQVVARDSAYVGKLICRAEIALSLDAADALSLVNQVLAAAPDDARGHCLLGRVALALGQPQAALAPLEYAASSSGTAEHCFWHQLCLSELAPREEALAYLHAASGLRPEIVAAAIALGLAFERLEDREQAAHCLHAATLLDPGRADAHAAHGRVRYALGQDETAAEAYVAAARCDPNNAGHHLNLSAALYRLGRFEEARAAAAAAIAINPDFAAAHENLADALLNLNRSAEAIDAYRTAIELSPDNPKPRFGLSLALLKRGDYPNGWASYEHRWLGKRCLRPDLAAPLWQGEDLHDRTILLWGEQGLGDMLQFVRFTTQVAQRGGRVVLQVPHSLFRLLRSVDGVSEIITDKMPMPPIDLHCPLGTLPLVLSVGHDTIPGQRYLHMPPDLPQAINAPARAVSDPLLVGLVWAGDPRPGNREASCIDRRRSMHPAEMAPLLDVDEVRFVSFQFGASAEQRAATGVPLEDALADVSDFAGTAACLSGIDLLISVDTSIVHLAGGLGRPVWMLSRFDACWRWLEDRADTPWYPTMRIFRQPKPDDWPGVVASVRQALSDEVALRTQARLAHRLG